MIEIDPPYNTGNDFIYPDNYTESLQTYLEFTGQVDNEGRKYSTNTEADGRFHSKWMNMMYPRLYLARNLLREDGVIFVHIDDNEIDNLRKLCNELFGEENFIATIAWQKKYAVSNDDPGIAPMHDYILVFQKSENFERNLLPRTEKQTQRYTNLDNDPRGVWSSDNYISNKSRYERPTLWYPIRHPKSGEDVWPEESAVWRYSCEKHLKMETENRLYWGPDLTYKRPRIKRFLSEVQDGVVPSTWWPFQEVGHNDEGQKETAELIGPKVFSTPKPVRLIKRIIELGAGKNDIVLDFFAGSGATAHAVLDLNRQDNGNRKFILVQLPEPTGRDDYKTIADITKERVRRVIKKIKGEQEESSRKAAENAEKTKHLTDLFSSSSDSSLCASASLRETSSPDLGFKVFKLSESNFKTWNPNITTGDAGQLVEQLEAHIDHIKPGRTQEDILFEILLKSGFPLSTKVETLTLAGKTVYSIAEGAMLICLERNLTQELIKAIADKKPMRVVCLDEGFTGNDQLKTNAVQTMKARGVINFRTV